MSPIKNTVSGVDRPKGAQLRKALYLLPNLLTLANMVLGILAIAFAINDSLNVSLFGENRITPFVWPARLILFAIILDFMDGRVARATGTTSKFGMEFDSMADLVSFGMAPAFLIYLSVLKYMNVSYMSVPTMGVSIMVLYVVCAAARLARFNVQAQIEEKDHFVGLPSPAAAGLLASYVLLSHWKGYLGKQVVSNVMDIYEKNFGFVELFIPVLTIVVALVMVSTIPYPSLKKMKKETISLTTLAMIAVIFFFLIYAAELVSFVLLTFYLFWGIIRAATRKGADRLRGPKAVH